MQSLEHQSDTLKDNWDKTSVTQHSKLCHNKFNWLHQTTLGKEGRFYPRRIMEALVIQALKMSQKEAEGVNRDNKARLSSQTWHSFFHDWRCKEPGLKRWHNRQESSECCVQFENSNSDQLTSQSNSCRKINVW